MTEGSDYRGGDLELGSAVPENVLRAWKEGVLVFDREAKIGSPLLEEGPYVFEIAFHAEAFK